MDGREDGVYWFQKAANGNVPADAWKVESPGREPQYVARAWFGNDVAFGRLHPPHKGAYFPLYGEKRTSNYEILCVSPGTHAHWERASDFLKRSKMRDGDDRLLWDQNQEVVVASTWNKGYRVPGKWYHPTSTNTGWFSYDGEEHMKSPHEFDVLVIAAKQAPLNDSVWFQEAAGGLVPKCAFEISTGRNSESHFIALANEKEWQAFGQVVPSKKTAIFPIFGETRRTTYNVLCAAPGTNLRWEPAAKWKQSTAKADGSRLVVAERAGIVVASCILDGARSLGKWHHPLFSDGGGWFPRGGTEVCVDADKFEVLVMPPALLAYESEVAEALDAFALTVDSLRKIAQRVEEDGSRGAEPAAIEEVKREVVAVAGQLGKIERRIEARSAALNAKAEDMADAQNAERCVKERRAAEREVQKALAAERQRVKEALKRVKEGLEEIWPDYRLEN
ncbi:hypothetical protein HK405_004314 [Cladochytrium tenue]|nr:hypothetical protein HK405_004314 [Cladochytrium tenue]